VGGFFLGENIGEKKALRAGNLNSSALPPASTLEKNFLMRGEVKSVGDGKIILEIKKQTDLSHGIEDLYFSSATQEISFDNSTIFARLIEDDFFTEGVSKVGDIKNGAPLSVIIRDLKEIPLYAEKIILLPRQ